MEKEVYWFIEGQLKILKENKNINIYFVNILDGDEAYNGMKKFNYIKNLPEYTNMYILVI